MWVYAVIVFLILLVIYVYTLTSKFTITQQMSTIQADVSNLVEWFQSMNVITQSLKKIKAINFLPNDLAVINSKGVIDTTQFIPASISPVLGITIDMSVVNKLMPIVNLSGTSSEFDIRSALYSAPIVPSIKIDQMYYSNVPPATTLGLLTTWVKSIYTATVTNGVYNGTATQNIPIASAFCVVHTNLELITSLNLINFHNYMAIIIANASNLSIYKGYTVFNDLITMYGLL